MVAYEADMPTLVENAMMDVTEATYPRRPTLEDVTKIIMNLM